MTTVDREARLIRGVCVAQKGPARGHFYEVELAGQKLRLQMVADETTLQGIVDCASEYKSGVKVCDAPEHKGAAIGATVGILKNFAVEGDKVVADLEVFDSYADADSLFEAAEKIPDTFGLSMVSTGKPEIKDGVAFIRCQEILSVDIVPNGALTPDGLFAVKETPAGAIKTTFLTASFGNGAEVKGHVVHEPTGNFMSDPIKPPAAPPAAALPPASPAEPIKAFVAQISDTLKLAMTTDDLAKQCNAVIMVASAMRELCGSLIALCYGLTGSAYQMPAIISEADAAGMVAEMAERFAAARKSGQIAAAAPPAPPAAALPPAPAVDPDALALKVAGILSQKFNLPAAALPPAPPPVETKSAFQQYNSLLNGDPQAAAKFYTEHKAEIFVK